MIDRNELMCENYVGLRDTNFPSINIAKIVAVNKATCVVSIEELGIENTYTYNDIYPILLTAPILDKNGFEKKLFFKENVYIDYSNTVDKNMKEAHYCYTIEGFDGDIILEDHINNLERNLLDNDPLGQHGWYVASQIKHNKVGFCMVHALHQLQNLYFVVHRINRNYVLKNIDIILLDD